MTQGIKLLQASSTSGVDVTREGEAPIQLDSEVSCWTYFFNFAIIYNPKIIFRQQLFRKINILGFIWIKLYSPFLEAE